MKVSNKQRETWEKALCLQASNKNYPYNLLISNKSFTFALQKRSNDKTVFAA
jgi:hypothetical protein